MPTTALAVTPLLLYVFQLAATVASQRVTRALGRRRALFTGSALTAVACAGMAFVPSGSAAFAVYGAVPLLGVGLALSMVVSVSMEADLVGIRTSSAAFVYGACSFSDKLLSGVFILAIQALSPAPPEAGESANTQRALYIRLVNAMVPAAAALCAAAVAATLRFPRHPPSRVKGPLQSSTSEGGGESTLVARPRPRNREASVGKFFANRARMNANTASGGGEEGVRDPLLM
jgi:Na+/melibiose symporter-like transporter